MLQINLAPLINGVRKCIYAHLLSYAVIQMSNHSVIRCQTIGVRYGNETNFTANPG